MNCPALYILFIYKAEVEHSFNYMHARPGGTCYCNSLSMLSGAENALIGYYPMNEGKGLVVFDKAHGSNAALNGLWSTPAGKAISLSVNGYVKLNTSFAPVLATMDYTIEMWFKGDATQTNTTLASNGRGDGTEFGGSLSLFNLGFESGLLTFQNNALKFRLQVIISIINGIMWLSLLTVTRVVHNCWLMAH